VHQNTDNWHMHIAINKVHPETFRNIEPFRDHFRLQEACAELEVKHRLIQDNHTSERGKAKKARGKAADFEAFQGYPSFLQWVRESAGTALLNARDGGQGWQGLHRVASAYDLEIKPRGAGLVIGDRSGRLQWSPGWVYGGYSGGAFWFVRPSRRRQARRERRGTRPDKERQSAWRA
jgi:hypothetical protein